MNGTWVRPAGPAFPAALLAITAALPHRAPAQQAAGRGLTAVPGIRVGHETLDARPTGCTVVLPPEGAVGGVDVRGGAPGTRETDLLDPVNTVARVDAVVLSGGSAFGLDAASGVVRHLEEQHVGFAVGDVRVPIVVGAILYDLGVGDPGVRPDAECGYRAAALADTGRVVEGSVGAGAGATVGKVLGLSRAMRGGLGTAAVTLPNGVTVAALVVVNALGDVIDPDLGEFVAGVRTADGSRFADARALIREGRLDRAPPGANTVIGVVATDARLTKAEATKVAQMAQDGIARTVVPSHTPWDGDTMFALATGAHEGPADVLSIGALAAEVVAEAVLRGVRAASGLSGLPAASDIAPAAR